MRTHATRSEPPDERGSRGWVRHAPWLLAVGLLAVRLAEQAFVGGYELAADEAQYWDWSRRLDLSYYTKGPGIAWAIAASTRLLGNAEWAVRLPSLLAWAGTVLVAAALAKRACGEAARRATRERAAAFAAVFAVCCPVLFAVGQFATIDSPYLFFWAVSAGCVILALERARAGRIGAGWWAAAGLAVGVSFLFKYTALLVLLGVVGASVMAIAWPRAATVRERVPPKRGMLIRCLLGWGVMLLAVAVAGLPVGWWNHVHGWPTVAHLLGHLGMKGGDLEVPAEPTGAGSGYQPVWTLSYLGTQLAIAGPGLWLLFASMTKRLVQKRSPTQRLAAWTLWWLFVTPLVFYLVVTFFAEAEANWPIAGYATAVALAGAMAPRGWRRWKAMRRRWRSFPEPRPKWGLLRKSPETLWQTGWHWTLAWGGVAAVGVVLGPLLLQATPGVEADRVLQRVAGHEAWADAIMRAVRSELTEEQLADAAWASDRYGEAALLAYYLPTRPSVHSIESLAGGRESSYDYFADTNLWRDELKGKPMIAVGSRAAKWRNTLRFEEMTRIYRIDDNDAVFLLKGYRGPQAPAPTRRYAPGIGEGLLSNRTTSDAG